MSDLQNQTPADTYKGLLQVGDYTSGVDSTSKYVLDGEGTPSALSVSTTKVGVGTVSPSAELDVSGNVVADEYALDGTGSSSSAVAIHAPTTNELAIRTSSSEAMRIDSSGNCGIGTTSPDYNLSVVSDTDPAKIGIHGYGGFSDGSVAAQLLFLGKDSNGGNRDLAHIQVREHADASGTGSMEIFTRIGGNVNARITIDSNGRVGIGTTSPSAPLEVASTTGGVIMPRMTTTQRDAISSPTDGEMIYNTTTNKFQGRANGAWVDFH